jgi:hypothetical protein
VNEETVAHGGLLSQKEKYLSINTAFKTLRPESITLAL